jgi:hypothetical protein
MALPKRISESWIHSLALRAIYLVLPALLGQIPSAAWAGCGDYVVIGNPRLTVTPAATVMSNHDTSMPSWADSAAPVRHRPSTPQCQGPQCRRSFPTMPARSPSAATSSFDVSAMIVVDRFLNEQAWTAFRDVSSDDPSSARRTRIERPPRTVS